MPERDMKPAKTVNEYIARYPPEVRKALRDLRKTIRSAAPQAEERIGWGMPGYKHHGWLVFFGGFKDHCSFFVASTALTKTLKKELAPYKPSGGTVHFTPERPLPAKLVKSIVKMRMAENELRKSRPRKSA